MPHQGIFRNLVSSLVTRISVAGCNFLVLVLTARYLGVQSRGEISIFLLNITVLQMVNEIFTGYSLIHFIPRFSIERILRLGLVTTMFICTAGSIAIVCLRKQVPGYEVYGWLVTVLVVLHTFNCVILLGRLQVKQYNLLCLAQPVLLVISLFTCLFVFRIFTFEAYFYSLLVSFLVVFGFSTGLVLSGLRTKTDTGIFKLRPLIVNGFLLQSAAFMYIFSNRFTFYLLPDSAKVGLYSSATSLMEALLLFAHSITPVLAARVANNLNPAENANLTLSLAKMSFLVGLLLIATIALVPEPVFLWVLGDGFIGIRSLMLLYSPAVLMASLFIPLGSYFSSMGKQRKILAWYAVGFLVALLLAPVLVLRYDVRGAAYTAVISYTIMGAGILMVFVKENKFTPGSFFRLRRDYMNLRQLLGGKAGTSEGVSEF